VNTKLADPSDAFVEELRANLAADSVSKVVLAKYSGPEQGLVRVTVRPLVLKEIASLSFVWSYRTKDITKNSEQAKGIEEVRALIDSGFARIHLLTATEDIELSSTKKGAWTLRRSPVKRAVDANPSHDREKSRYLTLDQPFLTTLGITDKQHRLIPSMSRKWKQINKFAEVLDQAVQHSHLSDRAAVSAVDFGSGKGYLTFALHSLLTGTLGKNASVIGVELRPELATLTEDTARGATLDGLSFVCGDVSSFAPAKTDIMVALHACDTATDHAIHYGISAGANIIVCSPCCHKELRPQLTAALSGVLQPMLTHGVHQGTQAEMLTDAIRALLLEAHGYETKVFEFISPEETSKNKMILGIKRPGTLTPERQNELLDQITELKEFFGIRMHTLESLLSE
jgi:Methyltransferase domain